MEGKRYAETLPWVSWRSYDQKARSAASARYAPGRAVGRAVNWRAGLYAWTAAGTEPASTGVPGACQRAKRSVSPAQTAGRTPGIRRFDRGRISGTEAKNLANLLNTSV